ncbi:hypothetical protein [Halomonas stenophila]|uniref:Quinol:cytochrome C oxidoreductase n=1 Tax=Halomonas stenophila TaxID=795312 RepID=A0A7W5ESZ1_9GAMM|nr:hypothetical protein [Halomonas stenophila]MBB3230942.1 hypothetical protein [Halomonas stenophila]
MRRPVVFIVAAALAVCLLGIVLDARVLVQAWLAACLTWGMLPLGAQAVLLIHGLTGGAWGDASRHLWQALASTTPLFLLVMLVPLVGMGALMPWMAPLETLPEVVQHKRLYLNAPFFVARNLIYALIWGGLAWWLCRPPQRQGKIAAPGAILWVLAVTFFGFDWFMSLEPTFYSDVFGLELMTIAVSSAMALGLLLEAPALRPAIRGDIANLWLAMLLGWAFMAFSQLIIIWSGNLPHEIGWYLKRSTTGWQALGRLAFALFLFVPFVMLLSSALKRHARWLRIAAAVCLVGHVLHMQWLIWPAFSARLDHQAWLGPAALIAVGGLGYLGVSRVMARPLAPREVRHERH